MNRFLRIRIVALAGAALAALAGCSKIKAINAPPPVGGNADYSVVASIGTSVSAGYESGGLVVAHQTKAFPYAFAHAAGTASYTIPSVGADGIPPLLRIAGWTPQGQPIINNTGRTLGSPTNLAQPAPYHNMSVPGAILFDVTSDLRYSNPALPFQFIARPSLQLGSILDQVAKLNPTFLTFEMGANEVLGPATKGSGTPLVPVGTFTALLHATLDSVAVLMPNVKAAIFTVPGVTSLPYFTTISPRLDPTGACRVIGSGGPLTDNDLVLLTAGAYLAAGRGVPVPCGGTGAALPDSTILLAANAASIDAAVDGYNAAIRAEASARGYALVDLHGLLQQGAGAGFLFQGQTYTSAFITGGLITLDGVHPTDLGHGILCNALIDAVNAQFGSRIPRVNLADFATLTSSRVLPAGGTSAIPIIENAGAVYGDLFGWRRSSPFAP